MDQETEQRLADLEMRIAAIGRLFPRYGSSRYSTGEVPASGQVQQWDDTAKRWRPSTLSYAPIGADYLVGTTQAGLTSEIVVGTAPGGDLGGTWASPTVTDLTIASEAQGDILYFNGTKWVRLAAGTAGQYLQTLGTGANPAWAAGGASMKMPEIISTHGLFSLGPDLAADAVAAPISVAWGTANLAIYIPIMVTETITIVQLWLYNGGTANGNVDMGIYQTNGTKLRSMGATGQSGTNTVQSLNIDDTQLTAGIYYLGISLSSATGTVFISQAGGQAARGKALGLYQQTSANPLPSPATFATYATPGTGWVPLCGMSQRTTI